MVMAGDVISYLDMCRIEGVNLQRGMNYRLHGDYSVILMSLRHGAPYADKVEENGHVLIYEGHDVPKTDANLNPKAIDQQMSNPNGKFTQNGLFYQAAARYKNGKEQAEIVSFAQSATEHLNYATDVARREIDTIREYRTRLIADVVTGKLDVREAAASLSEEPEDRDLSPVQDETIDDTEDEIATEEAIDED